MIIKSFDKIEFKVKSKTLCFSERICLAIFLLLLKGYDEQEHQHLINKDIQNIILEKDIDGVAITLKITDNYVDFELNSNFFEHFSIEEYENIIKEIKIFLDKNYSIGDFHILDIDIKYLENTLGIDLPYIVDGKIEKIKLKNLRCFSKDDAKGVPLVDGRYYKALVNNDFDSMPRHKLNYINETNLERMKELIESINRNGYSTNGNYIILYNQSNVIRDGEHRSAYLYQKFGENFEVPVLRIKFTKNYYSYSRYKSIQK